MCPQYVKQRYRLKTWVQLKSYLSIWPGLTSKHISKSDWEKPRVLTFGTLWKIGLVSAYVSHGRTFSKSWPVYWRLNLDCSCVISRALSACTVPFCYLKKIYMWRFLLQRNFIAQLCALYKSMKIVAQTSYSSSGTVHSKMKSWPEHHLYVSWLPSLDEYVSKTAINKKILVFVLLIYICYSVFFINFPLVGLF